MKIAIMGTRGIPNRYGGFEQVTEWLAQGLVEKGHEVFVYNSHNHANQEKIWKGVHIIHCYDPEFMLKTAGQFIYDLNCIRDARKRNYDVILFMGYTSSSIWAPVFPKKPVVISNMDGFEWKRTKYSATVRRFLQYAESLAVKHSHFHISDSVVIQQYIREKYLVESRYIPYGPALDKSEPITKENEVPQGEYFLLMARMEPENNVEMILDGFMKSQTDKRFIVVGNLHTAYGRKLAHKFNDFRIIFKGGIFDQSVVQALREAATIYFHGHSVGGTNPSLLEAMNAGVVIAAHKNPFNKAVLGNDAFYFTSAEDVRKLIDEKNYVTKQEMICNNRLKLENEFNREKVIQCYADFITECYNQKQ
jgi:glycosyltransferase involved in cell wall biosynthesis